MAVIQLGALVTKIKGSIGGTSFKSQRTTNVMYRKSNGYSKSKSLLNAALQYSRYIFTRWSFLTPEEKEGWSAMAAIIFFPDKFGNSVHITGRQLYTKTNLNLQQLAYYSGIDPGFNTAVPLMNVSNAVMDSTVPSFTVDVELLEDTPTYILVSAEVSGNPLPAPIFSRRETLILPLVTTSATLDLAAAFFAKYPYVTNAYNIRLYLTPMNIYGIKGLPVTIIVGQETIVYSFEPFPYVEDISGSIGFAVATNVPLGSAIRVYSQVGQGEYAPANFQAARLVTTTVTISPSVVPMGFLLDAAPFYYSAGGKLTLWIEVQDPDGNWLPAQSIIKEGDSYPVQLFTAHNYIVDGSFNVKIPITSEFPVGKGFVVYYQYDTPDYPEPEIILGQSLGTQVLDIDFNIDLGQLVNDPPLSIGTGNKVNLWLSTSDGLGTALPIQYVRKAGD